MERKRNGKLEYYRNRRVILIYELTVKFNLIPDLSEGLLFFLLSVLFHKFYLFFRFVNIILHIYKKKTQFSTIFTINKSTMVWILKDFKLWYNNFRVATTAPQMIKCTILGDVVLRSQCAILWDVHRSSNHNGLALYNWKSLSHWNSYDCLFLENRGFKL